jgi:hypothetical protein
MEPEDALLVRDLRPLVAELNRLGSALSALRPPWPAYRPDALAALRRLRDSVTAFGEKVRAGSSSPCPVWPVEVRDALIAATQALADAAPVVPGEEE